MMYAVLAVVALVGWVFRIRWDLRRCQHVRRTPQGLLSRELWRRTYLAPPTPGEFPQPREERMVAWCLVRIPLWVRRSIIALPLNMDAQIDAIAVETFDHHFGALFALERRAPALRHRPTPRRWFTAHSQFH